MEKKEDTKKDQCAVFLERRKLYKKIKEELWVELREMMKHIEDIDCEEEEESQIKYLNHMLKHITEIANQCGLQVSIYNAFLDLSDDMSRLRNSLGKL